MRGRKSIVPGAAFAALAALGLAGAVWAQDATPPPAAPLPTEAPAPVATPTPPPDQPIPTAPPPASAPDVATQPTQAPPVPVQAQPLTPLDLFSSGRDTGLGPDLWKGSSADLARNVIPTLVDHPLSPAGQALARRILATAAAAPDGAGADADLAAARARALLAMGDAATAGLILDHTGGLANSAALSETAAEAALIDDQNDKACAIGDALAVGRDQPYWLKLRAFCQARAGKSDAQISADLAVQQGKDPVFDRMIAVIIAGAGDPGPASLTDGLHYAMSQQLKLDLGPAISGAAPAIAARLASAQAGLAPPATPTPLTPPAEPDVLAALAKARDPTAYAAAAHLELPAIVELVQAKTPLQNPVQLAAAALAAGDPATALAIRAGLTGDSVPGADSTDLAILDAALAVAQDKADGPTLDQLIDRSPVLNDSRIAARAEDAAAFVLALGWPADSLSRAEFAGYAQIHGDASPALILLLNAAADAGVRGDTALLALSIAEPGAAAGPAPADRAAIIRALDQAGLKDAARGFALEGLLALERR